MPRKTVAPPRSRQRAASAKTATPDLPLFALARQVRSWADTLLSVTGSAADIGLSLTQARVKDPKRKQAVAKAGTQLRRGCGRPCSRLRADRWRIGSARTFATINASHRKGTWKPRTWLGASRCAAI